MDLTVYWRVRKRPQLVPMLRKLNTIEPLHLISPIIRLILLSYFIPQYITFSDETVSLINLPSCHYELPRTLAQDDFDGRPVHVEFVVDKVA